MKRKKYKGAVQGFVVEAGGRLGPAAKKFIDEVVAECDLSEVARNAAASKIMHKQACEEQFMRMACLRMCSIERAGETRGFLFSIAISEWRSTRGLRAGEAGGESVIL